MAYPLPPYISADAKVMMFVDGENLSIRYGKVLRGAKPDHVVYEPNTYVWSECLNLDRHVCEVIRKYYYTCVQGDDVRLVQVEDDLKAVGIEAPCVFKKTKGRGSKRVDISLTIDMLTHAHRKNYDIAVLVAGDEDYVPLVEAVMAESRRVVVWFFRQGLNPHLKRCADYFFDVGEVLLETDSAKIRSLFLV